MGVGEGYDQTQHCVQRVESTKRKEKKKKQINNSHEVEQ